MNLKALLLGLNKFNLKCINTFQLNINKFQLYILHKPLQQCLNQSEIEIMVANERGGGGHQNRVQGQAKDLRRLSLNC